MCKTTTYKHTSRKESTSEFFLSFCLHYRCCNTPLNSSVNTKRKWLRGQSTTERMLECCNNLTIILRTLKVQTVLFFLLNKFHWIHLDLSDFFFPRNVFTLSYLWSVFSLIILYLILSIFSHLIRLLPAQKAQAITASQFSCTCSAYKID